MRRTTARVWTYVAGALLFAFGVYNGVALEGGWDVWAVVMSGGPIALSLLLLIPGAVDRGLDSVAPYIPFLHDHEDE